MTQGVVNKTGCRSLDQMADDSRVLDIYREEGVSDSRFLYTAVIVPGWHVDGCHSLVADSVAEMLTLWKRLTLCSCVECRLEQ